MLAALFLVVAIVNISIAQQFCRNNIFIGLNTPKLMALDGDNLFVGFYGCKIMHWKLSDMAAAPVIYQGGTGTDIGGLLVVNDTLFFSPLPSILIFKLNVSNIAAGLIGSFNTSYYSYTDKIAAGGDFLFSTHVDNTIRRWRISTMQYLGVVGTYGLYMYVTGLAINGENFFSASADDQIKQWRISDGQYIKAFIGGSYIGAITSKGDYLFAGWGKAYQSFYLAYWRISTGERVALVDSGYTSAFKSLVVSGDYLFSAAQEFFRIKQWQISTGLQLVRALSSEEGAIVQILAANKQFLFSGSYAFLKQWAVPELLQISTKTIGLQTVLRTEQQTKTRTSLVDRWSGISATRLITNAGIAETISMTLIRQETITPTVTSTLTITKRECTRVCITSSKKNASWLSNMLYLVLIISGSGLVSILLGYLIAYRIFHRKLCVAKAQRILRLQRQRWLAIQLLKAQMTSSTLMPYDEHGIDTRMPVTLTQHGVNTTQIADGQRYLTTTVMI